MTCFIKSINKERSTDFTVEDMCDWQIPISLCGDYKGLISYLEDHDCFMQARPYSSSLRFVKEVYRRNDVCYVTAQETHLSRMHTLEWLNYFKYPEAPVHFCTDKNSVVYDIIVEDSVVTAEAADLEGRFSVLVRRPWNSEYVGNVPLLGSYSDILDHIRMLSIKGKELN